MAYETPNVSRLGIDPKSRSKSVSLNRRTVSSVDILGAVQSAYEEIGLVPERYVEVKRRLLEFAAEGELDLLVYHAIVDVFPPSGPKPKFEADC